MSDILYSPLNDRRKKKTLNTYLLQNKKIKKLTFDFSGVEGQITDSLVSLSLRIEKKKQKKKLSRNSKNNPKRLSV